MWKNGCSNDRWVRWVKCVKKWMFEWWRSVKLWCECGEMWKCVKSWRVLMWGIVSEWESKGVEGCWHWFNVINDCFLQFLSSFELAKGKLSDLQRRGNLLHLLSFSPKRVVRVQAAVACLLHVWQVKRSSSTSFLLLSKEQGTHPFPWAVHLAGNICWSYRSLTNKMGWYGYTEANIDTMFLRSSQVADLPQICYHVVPNYRVRGALLHSSSETVQRR